MNAKMMALGLILSAVGTPAPLAAAAQTEISLHIAARGEAQADQAVFTVPLYEGGLDRDTTEAQLHAKERKIVEELGKLGVAADQVIISDAKIEQSEQDAAPVNRFGFHEAMEGGYAIASEEDMSAAAAASAAASGAADAAEMAAWESGTSQKRKKRKKEKPREVVIAWAASSTLTVTVEPLEKLPEAMRVAGVGGYGRIAPQYVFKDEPAAHRRAIAAALESARSEADAYAEAMGYRVVRIASISNTEPPLSITDAIQTMSRLAGRGRGAEIVFMSTHYASVAIDYVIAPK